MASFLAYDTRSLPDAETCAPSEIEAVESEETATVTGGSIRGDATTESILNRDRIQQLTRATVVVV